MVEKKVVALGLICVILAVGLFGTVMAFSQKDSEIQIKTAQISGLVDEKSTLETQIASFQTEANALETLIANLQAEKLALETQVEDLQAETTTLNNEAYMLEGQVISLQTEANILETLIESLQAEKLALETQVEYLQSEIATLNGEILVLQTQVANLQSEIVVLEAEVIESFELGYAAGEAEGYQVGYDEGYLQGIEDVTENGWYLRDPTYNEANAFIYSDKTDENTYNETYVCYDFTADFIANAFQEGYMCGFVYIEFSSSAHAVACFNTTDAGLIYVEPQNDQIITLTIGGMYLGYVIVDLGIIW